MANRDGHRCIKSTTAVFGVALDCDGAGDWHQIISYLDSLGVAYLAYRSSGHTDNKPKWRLVLLLSMPLLARSNPKGANAAWHLIYRQARLVVGKLAGFTDPVRAGFDPAPSSIANIFYLGHRRSTDAAIREVRWRDGLALDGEALLAAANGASPTPTSKGNTTGKPSPRTFGFGSGPTQSTYTDVVLDAAAVVTLTQDGQVTGTVPLRDVTGHSHCLCPQHGGSGRGSAWVDAVGGRPMLWCKPCETRWTQPDPKRDHGIGLNVCATTGGTADDGGDGLGAPVEVVPDQVEPWAVPALPSPAEAPVVLVATPMCSRKSSRVAELLRGSHVASALVINPTIALATDGAKKFQAKLYATVEGKIILDEVWVVCAPSLRRVSVLDRKGNYVRPDVLVIEEIEQTMGIMHSAPIMRHDGHDIRGATYHRLARLCRSTIKGGGQVIALDAHASDRAKRDLQRLTAVDKINVIEAPTGARTAWTGMEEKRCAHPADLLTDLLDRAADPQARGIAYINSQIDLLAVEKLLLAKGRTVLAIHGDATPEAKATLADVNTHWKTDRYDWVLFNDAAGSGVSCDVGGRHVYNFTRVWPGYTWAASVQGVGRARRPAALMSWVEARKIGWSIEHTEVRAALLRQVEDTMTLTYGEDPEGRPEPAPLDLSYFESLVDHHWITRLRGRDVAAGYYTVREQTYGVRVVAADEMDGDTREVVMEAFQAAREAIKEKVTDDTWEADRIDDFEAESLARQNDLPPEKQAEVALHTTLDRWGRDDRDLVEDTVVGRGRRWRQARSLIVGAALLNEQGDVVREAERRRVEVGSKDGKKVAFGAQAAHEEARAAEIAEILRLAKFDLDRIKAPFRFPDSTTGWEPPKGCIAHQEGPFVTFGLMPECPPQAPDHSRDHEAVADAFESDSTVQDQGGMPAECPPQAQDHSSDPEAVADVFWSDSTLQANGFVPALIERAKRRDFGLLGIPTLPRDFKTSPARWLGLVLAEWGIETLAARFPEGVIDPHTGKVADDVEDHVQRHRKAEAAWKREVRAAKKEMREPDRGLQPKSPMRYRTIDWDAFTKFAASSSRANKRLHGRQVVSVEELAVLRLDPDEPDLPADLFEAVTAVPDVEALVDANGPPVPAVEVCDQVLDHSDPNADDADPNWGSIDPESGEWLDLDDGAEDAGQFDHRGDCGLPPW